MAGSYSNFLSGKGGKAEGCLFSFFTHLSHKVSLAGREIAPNTGANVTKFVHFGNQILKISHQIGN